MNLRGRHASREQGCGEGKSIEHERTSLFAPFRSRAIGSLARLGLLRAMDYLTLGARDHPRRTGARERSALAGRRH